MYFVMLQFPRCNSDRLKTMNTYVARSYRQLLKKLAIPYVLGLLLMIFAGIHSGFASPPDVPDEYAQSIEQQVQRARQTISRGPVKADFDQLSNVDPTPEWFKDAKLGIYFHWGPISVPAYNDFYAELMYKVDSGEGVYKHHLNHYGRPNAYPYTRFVPQFTAEKFDASRWAELFREAGARFAGPVTEHHDGYAMWDSSVTPWNAADTGPKRDLTGQLSTAIKQRGMKFVTTFHHAHNALWKPDGNSWNDGYYKGVAKHFPSLLEDPVARMIYGYMPRKRFEQMWLAKLVEVVDNYQPDLVWFDSWLDEISDQKKAQFAAYYYNKARQWGRSVGVTRKQNDLPLDFSIEDFEKGRSARLTERWWLTDDTINQKTWFYNQNREVKSTRRVLHDFIDIVSKRGCLLLNIAPRANGTIPTEQKEVLLNLGKWLDTAGEAIYNTRPWKIYGEGPTQLESGGHFLGKVTYTAEDLRYTRSKDGKTVYVIAMGWPGETLSPERLRITNDRNGTVQLLGYGQNLDYTVSNGRLRVDVPDLSPEERPTKRAFAFQLTGFEERPAAQENGLVSYRKPAKASNVYKGQVSRHGPSRAVDGDMSTRWATDADAHSAWIEIDLKQQIAIGRIKMTEAYAGRIQSHSLECWTDGNWQTIYRGNTVGSDYERSFDPVKTRRVRLRIHDAKKGPTIKEIRLYEENE